MAGLNKAELFEIVVSAVGESGWSVLYITHPSTHPFQLQVYRGDEAYRLRVYIWTLTHGGGSARPSDEYRIQITGVDQIQTFPGERTLLLGWWEPEGVFAGFDARKHSGPLGRSPSIQIRRPCLEQAQTAGFSPCDKGNQEIAIAFRPDFFAEYVRQLEPLHDFGQSPEAFEILSDLPEHPVINDETITDLDFNRRRTVVSVSRRLRNNDFRRRVLSAYVQRCAVCGVQLKLIDAAHIIPVNHERSTDETRNGLALCALHHRAYDQALVTVSESYAVVFNERQADELKRLGLDDGVKEFRKNLRLEILVPKVVAERPHVEFIKLANRIRGWP
jgi:putative restriction endonuclease